MWKLDKIQRSDPSNFNAILTDGKSTFKITMKTVGDDLVVVMLIETLENLSLELHLPIVEEAFKNEWSTANVTFNSDRNFFLFHPNRLSEDDRLEFQMLLRS